MQAALEAMILLPENLERMTSQALGELSCTLGLRGCGMCGMADYQVTANHFRDVHLPTSGADAWRHQLFVLSAAHLASTTGRLWCLPKFATATSTVTPITSEESQRQ